jgi:hypothetical protein
MKQLPTNRATWEIICVDVGVVTVWVLANSGEQFRIGLDASACCTWVSCRWCRQRYDNRPVLSIVALVNVCGGWICDVSDRESEADLVAALVDNRGEGANAIAVSRSSLAIGTNFIGA